MNNSTAQAFPRFNARLYLKEQTLGELGGLGAKVLSFAETVARLDERTRCAYEERAAIMEYDGELPRAEAEQQAYENVIQVDFSKPTSA